MQQKSAPKTNRGQVVMNGKRGTEGLGYREFSFIPKSYDDKAKSKRSSKKNIDY